MFFFCLWPSPWLKFHEFVGPFVKRWHFCVSLFIECAVDDMVFFHLFHCQSPFTDYNIQVTTQDDKMDFAVITDLRKKRISPSHTMDACHMVSSMDARKCDWRASRAKDSQKKNERNSSDNNKVQFQLKSNSAAKAQNVSFSQKSEWTSKSQKIKRMQRREEKKKWNEKPFVWKTKRITQKHIFLEPHRYRHRHSEYRVHSFVFCHIVMSKLR